MIKLPLNEKLVLHGPLGEINREQIREAEIIVQEFTRTHSDSLATFRFPSPDKLWETDADFKVWMISKGKYSGTWPKRYSTLVFKELGCRPPEKMLAKVGQILTKCATTETEYIVDFVDKCEWKAGSFGESSSSCWWSDYRGARIGLFRHGGMAMRFYEKNGRGCGRCWMFPHDEGIYIFNAYHNHDLSLYAMASLISVYTGVSYRRVELEIPRAYINGNTGFFVAPIDVLDKVCNGRTKTLRFAEDTTSVSCAWCGDNMDDDDSTYTTYDGEEICEDCYENRAFDCAGCRQIYHTQNCHDGPDNKQYCRSCFHSTFVKCTSCGTVVDKIAIWTNTTSTAVTLCHDCAVKKNAEQKEVVYVCNY